MNSGSALEQGGSRLLGPAGFLLPVHHGRHLEGQRPLGLATLRRGGGLLVERLDLGRAEEREAAQVGADFGVAGGSGATAGTQAGYVGGGDAVCGRYTAGKLTLGA